MMVLYTSRQVASTTTVLDFFGPYGFKNLYLERVIALGPTMSSFITPHQQEILKNFHYLQRFLLLKEVV